MNKEDEKDKILEEKFQEMKDYYNKQVTPKDEVDKEIKDNSDWCIDGGLCCSEGCYCCCECLSGL